jgi:hypothetical protein
VTANTSTTRSSRPLAWGVGLLALIMSVLTVLQVHRYGETRPPIADPAQGRTHAVKIHERVVYLTTGEFGAAVTSHVMAIGAIGVFLGLLLKSRAAKRNQGTSS